MTIIQPNKNNNPWRGVNAVLVAVLITAVTANIALSSKAEGFRFEAQKLKKEIDEAQLVNADLKGKIMKAIDTEVINVLAAEKGLIQDKNPQWVFALQ